MTFDGISSKNHKNGGEVKLLGFLYKSKVIFKLEYKIQQPLPLSVGRVHINIYSAFVMWNRTDKAVKFRHVTDRLYSRAVNWDSRVQAGLTSPKSTSKDSWTHEFTGTLESKQGGSTSPKSWTPSSSTVQHLFGLRNTGKGTGYDFSDLSVLFHITNAE